MNIKTVGIAITAFIILTSLISMLIPKGKMENVMKFVISLSFICLLITLLGNLELDYSFSFSDETFNYETIDVYNSSARLTEKILEEKIELELRKNQIELEYLKINTDISVHESIIINSVKYKCNDGEKEMLIKETIFKITGCENIERLENEEHIG